MKKITAVLVMLVIASLTLIACGPAGGAGGEGFNDVCLVTDSAGIGDKSFNDAVWMGLE